MPPGKTDLFPNANSTLTATESSRIATEPSLTATLSSITTPLSSITTAQSAIIATQSSLTSTESSLAATQSSLTTSASPENGEITSVSSLSGEKEEVVRRSPLQATGGVLPDTLQKVSRPTRKTPAPLPGSSPVRSGNTSADTITTAPIPSEATLGDTLATSPLQHSDTLQARADNLSVGKKILPEAEVHSPRKASLYSALLPGLGQAYNRKYWKIPIIYGGFAAFGYFIGWNHKNYKTARQAYSDLTDTIPGTDSYMKLKQIIYYDLNKPADVASLKQGLTSSQDYYRRNRDLLIIVTAAFYGLNIIDASVDAHFFNFDISDDLTFNWEPVIKPVKNQNIFCLNCTFRF